MECLINPFFPIRCKTMDGHIPIQMESVYSCWTDSVLMGDLSMHVYFQEALIQYVDPSIEIEDWNPNISHPVIKVGFCPRISWSIFQNNKTLVLRCSMGTCGTETVVYIHPLTLNSNKTRNKHLIRSWSLYKTAPAQEPNHNFESRISGIFLDLRILDPRVNEPV